MPGMNEAHDAWIRDGSSSESPVTESTPVIESAAAPVLDEAASQAAAGVETGEPSSAATPEDPPRNADGTFAPKAAATSPGDGGAVVTPPAVDASAAAAVAIEYLEARQGEKPYQIPKDISVPLKRNGQTEFVPLSEALQEAMMGRDYRIKTAEVGTERRAVTAEKARFEAERKIFEDERTQYEAALQDPEKLALWRQHYEAMRDNPVYRENFEKGREARVAQAELQVYKDSEREEVLQQAADNLRDEIKSMASEYPGVDPQRVTARYAELCQAGRIDQINRESIAQVYKEEAQYSTSLLSPLQKQIAELTATVEGLKATTAAAAHNSKTDKAIAQAKGAPVVAAVGAGGPPQPPGREPPKPFTLNELPERTRQWVRGATA